MGTRADFYVGIGKDSEWIGSVAWDGYPDNDDYKAIFDSKDESAYRAEVATLERRDDFTKPEQGWPWPWETSGLTDCVYAFHNETVLFEQESRWHPVLAVLAGSDKGEGVPVEFPDMSSRKNVTFGARSGVMLFGA